MMQKIRTTQTVMLRTPNIAAVQAAPVASDVEKCGFVYTGPAREGLPLICYEWQRAR